jgi:hypothetical protein
MDLPTVNVDEIEKYLQIVKGRGSHTLSMLGKLNEHFEYVYRSELGKELLKKYITRLEELLILIYNEQANEHQWAEFRVIKSMMNDEIKRIQVYLRKVNEIKKIVNSR